MTHCMGGLISSTVKKVEICSDWRAFIVSLMLLLLNSKYTSPRYDPLSQNLSLKGLFKGFVDYQMLMGWASPRHIAWLSSIEYSLICYVSLFYHNVDTEGILLWGIPYRFHSNYETNSFGIPNNDAHNCLLREHDSCIPYGRFLSRVFKDSNINLSRKTDFEAPSIYDTYDDEFMGWMKFEKAPDDSWVRKAKITQAHAQA